ncbi:MAG: cytidylate kinase-like family protein [Faecalibacterium sp.]|nr:cytidylate kinase-like family protein [Ruminococcus sp.]MCM1392846.1 cytidylate kinase-like family protein [Ruminococcus sp.]MCM1486324.1 cytidylate kinase-like family protein [Faecalibacterium sp.]
MRIITISREFASGGREVGKRLADELGFDYYDREIIDAVADKSELNANYVESMSERGIPKSFLFTFGRTFSYPDIAAQNYTKIMVAEQEFISEIAKKGRDFVIVGRSADIILKDYNPFNIFVYADMDAKIERCKKRADKDEKLSDRELVRKIKKIDSGRAATRSMLTDNAWGAKESYHLCINTTNSNIKNIIPAVGVYALSWFEQKNP